MKQKDHRKLDCKDKKHLLGLDVYFCSTKIYVVARKSIQGKKHRNGSTNFREVIYREERKEPGTIGIACIDSGIQGELFLSLFNSVKFFTNEGELFLVALSLSEDGETAEPYLIKVREECKFHIETMISRIPGFMGKEYDIPKLKRERDKPLSNLMYTRYPFHLGWRAGEPSQMLVVQYLASK